MKNRYSAAKWKCVHKAAGEKPCPNANACRVKRHRSNKAATTASEAHASEDTTVGHYAAVVAVCCAVRIILARGQQPPTTFTPVKRGRQIDMFQAFNAPTPPKQPCRLDLEQFWTVCCGFEDGHKHRKTGTQSCVLSFTMIANSMLYCMPRLCFFSLDVSQD